MAARTLPTLHTLAPLLTFLPSPLLGPAVWRPVARVLAAKGWRTTYLHGARDGSAGRRRSRRVPRGTARRPGSRPRAAQQRRRIRPRTDGAAAGRAGGLRRRGFPASRRPEFCSHPWPCSTARARRLMKTVWHPGRSGGTRSTWRRRSPTVTAQRGRPLRPVRHHGDRLPDSPRPSSITCAEPPLRLPAVAPSIPDP